MADNEFTRQLLRHEGEATSAIRNATIARNVFGSTDVIHAENGLGLRDSIIDQPGHLTLAYSGPANSLTVSQILSNDITSLPNDPSIISGAPTFVDAANGNYRLRLYSVGKDFAPPVVGDDRDLDNLPRDQDLPGVPDLFGVRDLGAYERQRGVADCGSADTIFCNDFDLL